MPTTMFYFACHRKNVQISTQCLLSRFWLWRYSKIKNGMALETQWVPANFPSFCAVTMIFQSVLKQDVQNWVKITYNPSQFFWGQSLLTWINLNHIMEWHENTNPFSNVNSCTVEVWKPVGDSIGIKWLIVLGELPCTNRTMFIWFSPYIRFDEDPQPITLTVSQTVWH